MDCFCLLNIPYSNVNADLISFFYEESALAASDDWCDNIYRKYAYIKKYKMYEIV